MGEKKTDRKTKQQQKLKNQNLKIRKFTSLKYQL